MYSLIVAATCLIGRVLAQTPPSYTLAETKNTLGLKYGKVNVIAGETLPYKGERDQDERLFRPPALTPELSAFPRTSTQLLDPP